MYGKIKNKNEIKQKPKKKIICPSCKEEIIIGIELNALNKINTNFYFPHIYLHGNPLHVLICYINRDLKLRNIGIIQSIEISRDSETLKQVMRKWSNPY